jgi:hypothetical protein
MVYTCLHNNRPSTRNRVIADLSASFDDASVTNVDVSAYGRLAGNLCTPASLCSPRISGLLQSRDGHASTNLSVPSYHNPARVKRLTAGPKNSIVSDG